MITVCFRKNGDIKDTCVQMLEVGRLKAIQGMAVQNSSQMSMRNKEHTGNEKMV